jgi:hypothetical protein
MRICRISNGASFEPFYTTHSLGVTASKTTMVVFTLLWFDFVMTVVTLFGLCNYWPTLPMSIFNGHEPVRLCRKSAKLAESQQKSQQII